MLKIYNFIFLLLLLQFIVNFSQAQAQEKDYEIAYKQAIKLFDENKSKEGFDLLNKAIGINPSYYDALYARSFYQMQAGEFEKALKDYNLLVVLYPRNPSLHLYRGQAKFALQKYEEAEVDYLFAYELDSTDSEITNALGSLYFMMDLYEDALMYLDKSIAFDANDLYAFYYRAYCFYYLKMYEKALADANTCLKIDAQDIDTQRIKSIILLAQKKYKEVISIYEALQKRNISFEVEDFFYWAMAYYDQKKYTDAQFYLEMPEKPQSADIYYYLGKIKFLLNNPKEALKKLDSAIVLYTRESEESAKVFYDRAIVKYKLKDLKGAEADFFYAIYLMPELIAQKNSEGNQMDLLGNGFVLLKMENQKSKLDSIRIKGFQDRAEALISTGDTNKAISEINKAIATDSLHSFSYTIRGTIQAMMAKYKLAFEDLEKAMNLRKGQSLERIYYVKGLIYNEMGTLEDAKDFLLKAIQINNKQDTYFGDLASIEFGMGDVKNALVHVNQAIQLKADNWEYYNDRAVYFTENLQFDKAIEDCNKVIQNDATNKIAFYYRGIAYQKSKKYSQAIEDFKNVLEDFPEDEEVNQRLRDCIAQVEIEKKKN